MKDEEFNNFLRERADSFELKPSSGSFGAVQRKMQRSNKRRRVIILFSLLVSTFVSGYFIFSTQNISSTMPTTVSNTSGQQPAISTEQNPINNVASSDVEITEKQQNTLANAGINNKQNTATATQTANSQNKKQQTKHKGASTSTITLGSETQNKNNRSETKDNGNTNAEQVSPIAKGTEEALEANNKDKKDDVADVATNDIKEAESKPVNETLMVKEIEPENKKGTTTDSTSKKCNCTDSKWAVKAYYNPFTAVYLNNRVQNNDVAISSNSIAASEVDEYTEELNGGWALGLKAERALNAKWTIGFGIRYSSFSLNQEIKRVSYTKDSTETYGFDPSTNQSIVTGYTVYSMPDTKDSTKVNVSLKSLQLPVYANYTFAANKRWQFGITGGFTASYIVAGKYTEVYAKQTSANTRDNLVYSDNLWQTYRRFNVNLNIGFDINYNISNCMALYANPTFGTSVFSLQSKNSQVPARRPLFMGVETGVRIKF